MLPLPDLYRRRTAFIQSIYLHAIRKGLLVIIFTNGTLIDRDMADFFARYPPLYIDITVFGATEETYERVSGVKGTFRRCREAVRLLAERDLLFGLKSVITTLHRHEVGEMKSWGDQTRFKRRRNKGETKTSGGQTIYRRDDRGVAGYTD